MEERSEAVPAIEIHADKNCLGKKGKTYGGEPILPRQPTAEERYLNGGRDA
jgi:hypothetical protein